MKRKTPIIITLVAIAAIITATATIVIKTPLQHPAPLAPARVMLNEVLTNDSSDFAELKGLDKKVEAYMKRWEFKGASLAITRNDSLLYAKGYGWADEEMNVEMQPSHIMRVASVSKLITAVGIMVLQDRMQTML